MIEKMINTIEKGRNMIGEMESRKQYQRVSEGREG